MSWRKAHGDYVAASPRALQPGDTIISQIGGGTRGAWHLRYYLVKPTLLTANRTDTTSHDRRP